MFPSMGLLTLVPAWKKKSSWAFCNSLPRDTQGMKLKMSIFQEAKDAVPQTSSLWAGSFEVPNKPRTGLRGREASYRAPEQLAAAAKVPSGTGACKDPTAWLIQPWSSALHCDSTPPCCSWTH